MLAKLLSKLLCKLLSMLRQLRKHGKIPKAGNSLTSISCADQAEQGAKYAGQATERVAVQTTEYAELGWDS